MTGKRLYYFLALMSCLIVYILSGQWLSWLLLVDMLALPWISLAISIPALRGFRLEPTGGEIICVGERVQLWLMGSCSAPMPPFRGKIRLRSCFTDEKMLLRGEQSLPSDHCGGWEVTVIRGRVCDYLGIFSFRPRYLDKRLICVRPAPLPIREPEELLRSMAFCWRPKPGGGFSENHELRPYRPGDAMNGVHWKLSAKTGNLVVRQPMEPEQGRMLLTLDLLGSPEELDRKFGRLLWLGDWLLEKGLHFEIHGLTGGGLAQLPVSESRELSRAVDFLLCQPLAEAGSAKDRRTAASWQYHIGGEPDDA